MVERGLIVCNRDDRGDKTRKVLVSHIDEWGFQYHQKVKSWHNLWDSGLSFPMYWMSSTDFCSLGIIWHIILQAKQYKNACNQEHSLREIIEILLPKNGDEKQ